jgi:hypothetical protein
MASLAAFHGQKYEDTGTGFALLASVIEKVSGIKLQRVFTAKHFQSFTANICCINSLCKYENTMKALVDNISKLQITIKYILDNYK